MHLHIAGGDPRKVAQAIHAALECAIESTAGAYA